MNNTKKAMRVGSHIEIEDPNDLPQPEPVYDNDEAMFPQLHGYEYPYHGHDYYEYPYHGHDYNEPDESDGGWQHVGRAEDY